MSSSPGGRTHTVQRQHSNSRHIDPDDSENLNPDEVNKSLRLTANAIQNYSFDTGKGDKIKVT